MKTNVKCLLYHKYSIQVLFKNIYVEVLYKLKIVSLSVSTVNIDYKL